MSYDSLLPLMKKKGCSLSPEQFQERVNVIFHDHEAVLYDQMHADMKNSLQEQVDLLVSDLTTDHDLSEKKLHVLDIGCGTGLSTEFLLNTGLGPHIEHITLLDTSEKMLEYAARKARNWNKEYDLINSHLSDITKRFDLVLVCSVLHHIPDLKSFLKQVNEVLMSGGIFIHLQDPNADHLNDSSYLERLELYKKNQVSDRSKKKLVTYIPKHIRSSVNRMLGRKNYIDLINDQLIREKVITKRMTADELWSVTDIHVQTNGNSTKGISLQFLQEHLENFSLINQRSYGFFGKLKFDLPEKFEQEEEKFIAQNKLDGRNISAVWIKK